MNPSLLGLRQPKLYFGLQSVPRLNEPSHYLITIPFRLRVVHEENRLVIDVCDSVGIRFWGRSAAEHSFHYVG